VRQSLTFSEMRFQDPPKIFGVSVDSCRSRK